MNSAKKQFQRIVHIHVILVVWQLNNADTGGVQQEIYTKDKQALLHTRFLFMQSLKKEKKCLLHLYFIFLFTSQHMSPMFETLLQHTFLEILGEKPELVCDGPFVISKEKNEQTNGQ